MDAPRPAPPRLHPEARFVIPEVVKAGLGFLQNFVHLVLLSPLYSFLPPAANDKAQGAGFDLETQHWAGEERRAHETALWLR